MKVTNTAKYACSARLELNFGRFAKEFFDIIEKPTKYKRSEVRISREANRIVVEVSAKDATALAASLGSVLKQLSVVSSVYRLFKNSKEPAASERSKHASNK
ncbi:MAG: KEOPS complex subunit Pcc1 [Candidatus Micrarchaeaceae archaeon]